MSKHFPEAFVKRMKEQLKEDYSPFIEALQQPAAISFRLNPAKTSGILPLEKVRWSRYGYYLEERPFFALDPLFHGGAYYIQEASSMLLETVLRQLELDNKEITILDLCGAPGGKATNILSTITSESLLFTNETIRSRADILKENIFKWGYENVVVTNNDPAAYSQLTGLFDAIVVDAPCSGEGLFRKDAASIDQWSEGNLQLCCERQQRILHDVWPSLKEGGYLIYSTCTYNPEENERNLARFCSSGEAVSVKLDLKQYDQITEIIDNQIHGYYAFPHKNRGEGFFISIIKKISATTDYEMTRKKNKESRKKNIASTEIESYVLNKSNLLQHNEVTNLFPNQYHGIFELVSTQLNIVSPGLPVASVKQKNIIPEPALAFATELNKNAFNQLKVSFEDALNFLHKDAIDNEKLIKGYNLITYQNIGLGWIKKIDDRRSNNYFPKEWRIRMDLPEQLKEIRKQLPLENFINNS